MVRENLMNMFCGQIPSYKAMGELEKAGLCRIFSFCDHPTKFEWERRELESIDLERLVELYEKIKVWNKEEGQNRAEAQVMNVRVKKICFFKCSKCGYEKIAEEDNYCPACGEKLVFGFKQY